MRRVRIADEEKSLVFGLSMLRYLKGSDGPTMMVTPTGPMWIVKGAPLKAKK